MKVFLHNPHINSLFASTLQDYIFRIKSFKKYEYLLRYHLKYSKKVFIYCDGRSSFPSYVSAIVPLKLELLVWAIINRINPLRMIVIKDMNKIKDEDILISFGLESLHTKDDFLYNLKARSFLKIFHLTHYVQNISSLSANFKFCRGDFIIAENNLYKNSGFFRRYFPYYKRDVYLLPFVFGDRFKNIKNFDERKNKCLATGTIIKIKEFEITSKIFKDFYDYFMVNTLHPMRIEIYSKRHQLKSLIDSYISNFWEIKRKKWENINNPFKKWYMRLYNGIFATKRKYFKFDIVEKYNEYKMFIVPEEINDLPGIGFVEGMACGTAYIGKKSPFYSDIGLKPGIHYIDYDGSLKDLKNKIRYYQKHHRELELIAKNGYDFITQNLNSEYVAKIFWEDIKTLNTNFKKMGRKNLKFISSFVIK